MSQYAEKTQEQTVLARGIISFLRRVTGSPISCIVVILAGWLSFAISHSAVVFFHGLYAPDVVVSKSVWIVADVIFAGLGAILAGSSSIRLVLLYVRGIKAFIVGMLILGCQALGAYALLIILTFWASSLSGRCF